MTIDRPEVATNTSYSQTLLAHSVLANQDARDLPAAFENVARVLADQRALYAFAGRSGIARFCRAQWTDLVVVCIAAEAGSDRLAENLQSKLAASLSEASSLRLDLTFVKSATELRFLELAPLVRWFNVDVRMATAEHLLWLALSSNASSVLVDAIDLIWSGHIDWATFDDLASKESPLFRRRLKTARASAERTKDSSYSKMMEKRLAGELVLEQDDLLLNRLWILESDFV